MERGMEERKEKGREDNSALSNHLVEWNKVQPTTNCNSKPITNFDSNSEQTWKCQPLPCQTHRRVFLPSLITSGPDAPLPKSLHRL